MQAVTQAGCGIQASLYESSVVKRGKTSFVNFPPGFRTDDARLGIRNGVPEEATGNSLVIETGKRIGGMKEDNVLTSKDLTKSIQLL